MAVVSSFHSALRPFSSPSIPIPIHNPMNGEKRRRWTPYSNRLQCSSRPDEAKRISEQSSWESKDSEGKDYLYRLGQEADNMNIAVGARQGVIDDLFVGNFLGKDSDIVFDYRQKATRSFEYLQGDYYIAPAFLDKVACHIVKNYIAHLLNVKVPLILGIWGGKGQGKTFQTELIFRAMGIEPVIMSAGELESERAGEPGRLIRERYRTASQGKMSCLMINDIDAGLGRFDHEDIINIVHQMYAKDGITRDEVIRVVDTFPNQALDFYGALRSKTYDQSILKWVNDTGGYEKLGEKLLKGKKDGQLSTFVPPKQSVEALLESGHSLVKEQQLITNSRLSKECAFSVSQHVCFCKLFLYPRQARRQQIGGQDVVLSNWMQETVLKG
ncbi:hypothetical protein C4D60_Mb10t00600 [Musa balbisiana]|uniref:Ribulose bisphosphate carboxylase/oxygenase activase AAA helical domain-containing protein n=1 Tax=Musa balbisiana TaxID=52838 RepID=A0A4S8IV10_MUSBA|nr:hypothetical protein C4D60_Mb10t00600 [Musa balbisiana]